MPATSIGPALRAATGRLPKPAVEAEALRRGDVHFKRVLGSPHTGEVPGAGGFVGKAGFTDRLGVGIAERKTALAAAGKHDSAEYKRLEKAEALHAKATENGGRLSYKDAVKAVALTDRKTLIAGGVGATALGGAALMPRKPRSAPPPAPVVVNVAAAKPNPA